MDAFTVYKDIQARTKGQFLVGIVGPVRTGKSTFIRRFLEILALGSLTEQSRKELRDQLPQSGSGKMITTVEPKFVPREPMTIQLGENTPVKVRLIDSVGFLIPDAAGHMENEKERMVKTPWHEEAIPFRHAAEEGTRKVIGEHSTIGLMITTDGSFGEIKRENYLSAEEKTVEELKKQKKPFLILLNTVKPYADETMQLAGELTGRYGADCIPVNCEQLKKEDIIRIMEHILYEFSLRQVEFYIPKWVELLPTSHVLKKTVLEKIKELTNKVHVIKDINPENFQLNCEYVKHMERPQINLADGVVKVRLEIQEKYYYEMMSDMTGVPIHGEYELMHILKELADKREEYEKVSHAMEAVRGCGYGVVVPDKSEIVIEEPDVIRQGNKFGVRIKSVSPSIHMIKANIVTEIAPIVGSEEQAKDLITYIHESAKQEEGIWKTNIFGKSIEQLVEDGIRAKIAQITEDSQSKLQDSMQKIVNDSKGGMICIII
ncbi:MAG: stage IV sporulation protein A [Lachnospiraceae bacterium]|nr:stage IV sporulation protein A [Lachnospiraceae bacterium]